MIGIATPKNLKLAAISGILAAAFACFPLASAKGAQPSSDSSSQLIEHGSYVNRDGKVIHSPSHTRDGKSPPGATAQCRDKSYSFSTSRRGTCSGHGGVAMWL